MLNQESKTAAAILIYVVFFKHIVSFPNYIINKIKCVVTLLSSVAAL
ncbi:hypothetical protein MGSAQ_002285 [marine sediment metagenome]|uniref:Uncharacterized protein n=1 Tax=marine sediment metagenome TaxID=412755 RepID=A0A1B6NRW7_9ZZZZ